MRGRVRALILVATALLVQWSPQGLHPRRGQRPAARARPKAATGISFAAMSAHQQRWPAIARKDPNIDGGSCPAVGAAARVPAVNSGSMLSAPEGRARARPHDAGRGHPAAAAQVRRGAGHPRLSSRIRRRSSIGGRQSEERSISTPCRATDLHALYAAAQRLEATLHDPARLQRRHHRPADRRTRRSTWRRSIATGRRRWASRRNRSSRRSYNAYGGRPGVHHLHADQPVLGGRMELLPQYQAAISTRCARSRCGRRTARWCRSTRAGEGRPQTAGR